MTLADRLRNELRVLIVMAPEYGRVAAIYMSDYEKNNKDGTALASAMEFHFRSKLAYEKIDWINDLLSGEV